MKRPALGAVEMISASNRCEPYPAFFDGRTWRAMDGPFCVDEPLECRLLVVVDPEDREQVDRLGDALITAMCRQDPDWDESRAYEVRSHLRAALREFADPSEPKPEEPRGFGAVVQDTEGNAWVRVNDTHWESEASPNNRQTWGELGYVTVLAEGWSG